MFKFIKVSFHHITYMYIYRHLKVHQTILYWIIRDYIHFKIHMNYHSWTKYDNKKGSVTVVAPIFLSMNTFEKRYENGS